MGINNQDGSLYWATGIDNTGLIADKQKTLGLIRGMAKQISGFDVFAGLSASAAIAFSRVAKDAKRMSVEYEQAMKEYVRVVKLSGELMIIVWVTKGVTREEYKNQYSFNIEEFETKLTNHFDIHYSKILLDGGVGTYKVKDRRLVEYGLGILRK